MKESKLIDKIIKLFSKKDKSIVLGPGDDTAVIDFKDKKKYFLFTVDEIVENTHFILSFLRPQEIASKLVRMNVSDIYSMGDAKPLYCLVSGGINFDKVNDIWVSEFLNGLKKELDFFSIINIGGNLTKSKDIFFSMTLVGEVKKNKLIKRTGAKPGHLLCSVGKMGFSGAAVDIMVNKKRESLSEIEKKLVSLFVKPRIYSLEAAEISNYASAMIDNSDGLYKSAEILAGLNNIKLRIYYDKLLKSAHPVLIKWAEKEKKEARKYALFGGENYNLIFTIPEEKFNSLSKKIKDLNIIGFCDKGVGVEVLNYHGKIKNFEHFKN